MLDLTHAGAIRLERTDGAVTISIVRILERRVQTEILALSREEFHALAELFTEAAA